MEEINNKGVNVFGRRILASSEPNITFTHCSVIVSKHTEFCPDIAEFCLVKYFSASLIMHIHSVCAVPLPLFGARARNCAYGKILRDYIY